MVSEAIFHLYCNISFFSYLVSPFDIVSITPEDLIVSRGNDDRFTCVTDAGPDTFYVWLFNATELVCENSICSSGSIAAFNVTNEGNIHT